MLERLRTRRTTERGAKQRLRAIKRAAPARPGQGRPAAKARRKGRS